jgi:hypothetical protein
MFRIYFVAFFILIPFLTSVAQIESESADFALETDYIANGAPDTIFVFNKLDPDGPDNIGAITVRPPAGTWNMDIYTYNKQTQTFSDLFQSSTVNTPESYTNLEEGGYMVVLDDGSTVDTSVAWVYVNEFAEQEVSARIPQYTSSWENGCPRSLDFIANVRVDTFLYFDYINNQDQSLVPDYSFEWTGDPEDAPYSTIQETDQIWTSISPDNYPVDETTYSLQLTDEFNVEIEDAATLEVVALASKSEIDYYADTLYFDDGTPYYNPSLGETPNSAPYHVVFNTDKCENSVAYKWDFGVVENEDTTIYSEQEMEYTYYPPDTAGGKYWVKLITESPYGCSDIDSIDIEVDQPNNFIDEHLPNFFMPGTQRFGYFRPHDVSIKEFEITIFNKQGKLMHKFRGGNVRDWPGWDGSIRNSNRLVPDGVYYYIIKFTPFGGKTKKVSGFVHAFSNK